MIRRGFGTALFLFCLAGWALSAISGCASSPPGFLARDDPPMQLRSEQIIVALPLVAPTILMDTTRHLARQYDLKPVMGGFPLTSIGVHCAVFEVDPGTNVDELLNALANFPGVQLAQRNQLFETNAEMHSDPYASLQHGPVAMGVDRAHQVATGRGVRIAVVDTGVDRTHADLRDRIARTRNFVQGGEATFSADAHGTAVAGVIAASADDGVGIYGVAPAAELLAAKACWHGETGSQRAMCSSWTLALAVDYAIENGAQVLNLSLGGPPDGLLTKLLANARDRSIVVVAAAGDDAASPRFPASLDFVIGVVMEDSGDVEDVGGTSAHTGEDRVVAAPGQEILTTAPGGSYHFQSGSSLSTAHVTGLVALLLELDPTLTPERIHSVLEKTSNRTGPRDVVGITNACAALNGIDDPVLCP